MKTFKQTRIVALLILLVIIELCLTMYLAAWKSTFWDAVEAHNAHTFYLYIGYFLLAAMSLCFVASYETYLVSLLSFTQRTKLVRKALKSKSDHPTLSQIQQDDTLKYPLLLLNLTLGGIRNICLLCIYGYFVIQISPYYLLFPICYAILTSMVGYKIAFPLIDLNYLNQNIEAIFRKQLTKRVYGKVFVNNYNLAKATKRLGYWQIGVSQLSVVLPYLCLAGLYFSLQITLGTLMQVASAMNAMTDCFGFYLQSFNDINKFLSCKKRLQDIGVLK